MLGTGKAWNDEAMCVDTAKYTLRFEWLVAQSVAVKCTRLTVELGHQLQTN